MLKKQLALMLVCVSVAVNSAFAGSNFSYTQPTYTPMNNTNYYQQPLQYSNGTPLQGSVTIVPAGTPIPATLTTQLSSANATVGQTVTVVLNNDLYYNNKLVAPIGSTVYGSVIQASKAKHGSMNGKLCVRFNNIVTPYGNQIPISAVIRTDDNSGVLVGGTKKDVTKEYAKDLVGGSAVGAVSGVVFGALAGGNVGRGAALGTAVGAGGGLVKSIWNKGSDVEIPMNSSFDIVLTQPVTVTTNSYSNEN